MGIAVPVGACGPVVSSSLVWPERTPRLSPDLPDCPSGCFSNQHWQQVLGIEILDAKWGVHRAFTRPAARRRDCGKVRRRPPEVDLGRRRPAETLMRAEVCVVD